MNSNSFWIIYFSICLIGLAVSITILTIEMNTLEEITPTKQVPCYDKYDNIILDHVCYEVRSEGAVTKFIKESLGVTYDE